MKRFSRILRWLPILGSLGLGSLRASEMATLSYEVRGASLAVSPAAVSVPKGIAASIRTDLNLPDLAADAYIEAVLRGPAFPARRILGLPNQPLTLPPLNLVGEYRLDKIRLVDAASGATRLEGSPASVPIRVFEDVLVSRVTSRQLSLEEIQEKGIVIDEKNFRALEFEVAFVVEGGTFPVRFPVVAPVFTQVTEAIPAAEVEARNVQAALLNRELMQSVKLPDELTGPLLNWELQPIHFQPVVDEGDRNLGLRIPPIPALLMIPGNIGFLNQFFSVRLYTANAAPRDSGLTVNHLNATLVLPKGADQVAGTYAAPGDDPLRFARVGTGAAILSTLPVRNPGPDGRPGTADDVPRLHPGKEGQAEFLVEGLREGLHVMDVELNGVLEGLAAGPVNIRGKAAGAVLVRNPQFSLAFSHPRTVRAGEPYEASVTVLNTGGSIVNLMSVTLAAASVSGAALTSPETVDLGNLAPGETATATYRFLAQRTGSITFSQLTSDDAITGRFRLRAGVDERGVALSPDTILMPDFVDRLPATVRLAANRVLGQALSVASAPQLPPGVLRVNRSILEQRVLELAEAGQRLDYGDSLARVLADILLDWQGGRASDPGFQQILATTQAGRQFRDAMAAALETADALPFADRLVQKAGDLAGRGEAWWILAWDGPFARPAPSGVAGPLPYEGASGLLLVARPHVDGRFVVQTASAAPAGQLVALLLEADGRGERLLWNHDALPAGACLRFDANAGTNLWIDLDCDGTAEVLLAATRETVLEDPPQMIAAIQDTSVEVSRPFPSCYPMEYRNYGNVLGLLFSKPMRQEDVNLPANFRFDNGVSAVGVRVQPGGRVALLSMREPFGVFHPRELRVADIRDARGNALAASNLVVQATADLGSPVAGRVVRADNSYATNVPVTLTYYDRLSLPIGCVGVEKRIAQTRTDGEGRFGFDFIMAGVPYSLSATDVQALPATAAAFVSDAITGDSPAQDLLFRAAESNPDLNSLLLSLGVAEYPEAIAILEGVDRALFRDLLVEGTARIGVELNIALRFRGRGQVFGQVRDDLGRPVAGAAVNLFPAASSRELARGLFTGSDGRFAFQGVPLGEFTLDATDSLSRHRTVAGFLEDFGEIQEVDIVLVGSQPTVMTALQGRVFEADGLTPHAGARVIIGQGGPAGIHFVVAMTETGPDGEWFAPRVPVGNHDIGAISADGRRAAFRGGVSATAGVANIANLFFSTATSVRGRVEMANGLPVPGALVAGGEVLVRTDANGLFECTGVPVGRRSFSAGLEADPDNGRPFARLGSASADIEEGLDNFVVIRFTPAAALAGRVLDTMGQPVPNTRVVIPRPMSGGFLYTETDALGQYRFENLALDRYTVSSPGPDVSTRTADNIQKLGNEAITAIREGATEEEIGAALGNLFAAFAGVGDPLLEIDRVPFNPRSWGFNRSTLSFDGQVAVADIRHIPAGTVSGATVNGQGVPIGARVRLTGLGPDAFGEPSFIVRGERDSDPATGRFAFPGQALAGSWGLQAATPLIPVVVTQSGFTIPEAPDVANVLLQFPLSRETSGRLVGQVSYPDGTPVGSNTNVRVSFGDLEIRTRADGSFDTQFAIPEGNYRLEADDPITGLVGESYAYVQAGQTNRAAVTLLGRGSLEVLVVRGDGSPAANAEVEIRGAAYPRDLVIGVTGPDGRFGASNLNAGAYAASARLVAGFSSTSGRSAATVVRNQARQVTVVLGGVGTIEGHFYATDGVTPVPFAQITVGGLGFAPTDANGFFRIDDVPLGSYPLTGIDPLNGRAARATATLSSVGQVLAINLVEQALGRIRGTVVNGTRTGLVPGIPVSLNVLDGFSPSRQVTTGPDGAFDFPGVPPGAFQVRATDPVFSLTAFQQGQLAPNGLADLQLFLSPLGTWEITVLESDGVTPAPLARVRTVGAVSREADTDAEGKVLFQDLPNSPYAATASSLRAGESHSQIRQTFSLTGFGEYPPATLVLPGVGAVTGTVFAADGLTAVPGAVVDLRVLDGLFAGKQYPTVVSDAQGGFSYPDVPLAGLRASAREGILAGSTTGALTAAGETLRLDVLLGASVSYTGRVVRADASTPAVQREITAAYPPPPGYGLLGRALDLSDELGGFFFEGLPAGPVDFEMLVPEWNNAIVRFATNVTENGLVVDLGTLVLDEADPLVTEVVPSHGAVDIPIASEIVLHFSEPIRRHNEGGVYLQGPASTVPSQVFLEDGPNGPDTVVRLVPLAPMASQTPYRIFAISGDRFGPFGAITARGVIDRVDKPLPATFSASFVTRDDAPPLLVSYTPVAGAEQVDPNAVIRLSFNEPIQAGVSIVVTNAAGAVVPGAVTLGLNQRIAVFTPTQPLAVNQTFGVVVDHVRDLAGNELAGLPLRRSFHSLDTLGPDIALLRVRDNPPLLAGLPVVLEAELATPEAGVRLRFSANLSAIGESAANVFELPYILPTAGTVMIRAVAIDRFGNEGPLAELPLAVVPNQPPTVQFVQVTPASGPAVTGSTFTFDILGSDDFGVTELQLAVGNAASLPLQTTAGASRRISVPVFPNAGPGQTVAITARATDNQGLQGQTFVFNHPIADGVPPSITTFSPSTPQLVDVGGTVPVSVSASDAFGLADVSLLLTGAWVQTIAFPITPGMAAYTDTMDVLIPGNLQPYGNHITAQLRVTDASGFTTFRPPVTWNIRGTQPPSIQILSPDNFAEYQPGDTIPVTVQFSDDIGVASVRLDLFNAMNGSVGRVFAAPSNGVATLDIVVPMDPFSNRLIVHARAIDGLGQFDAWNQIREFTLAGVNSPPRSEISGVFETGDDAVVDIEYEVTLVPDSFSHVELFFRRNGIGTYNRYVNEDEFNDGWYFDQGGTITFDSTRMGGDGDYEFYTVAVSQSGAREQAARDGLGAVIPDATHTFAAGTVWELIDADTVLDSAYDGSNLRVDGATVTVDGAVDLQNVDLLNGAVLTHFPTTGLNEPRVLELSAWTLSIDASSRIDVSGQGYPGGQSRGNPSNMGRSIPTFDNPRSFPNGGSYAGPGGTEGLSQAGISYGDPRNPEFAGSGGMAGSSGEPGGDGGGRIRLNLLNLAADGDVLANGTEGQGGNAGSGAGGGIYLEANSISGSGRIQANGGAHEIGGSGGRIALYFLDMENKPEVLVEAAGGRANDHDDNNWVFAKSGAHGTIFIGRVNGDDYREQLVYRGYGARHKHTPLSIPSGTVHDLILEDHAQVEMRAGQYVGAAPVTGQLILRENSWLTHEAMSSVFFNVENFELDESSRIDVTGKGYRGGRSDGNLADHGLSPNDPATTFGQGGSHGGPGGGVDAYRQNTVFGSPRFAMGLGAGGHAGWSGEGGGNGGGRVLIYTHSARVDGLIRANGREGGGGTAGSGAGGSVFLVANDLGGTGMIEANGGDGQVGGSGGRVGVIFENLMPGADFDDHRHFRAYGGRASVPGGAGTVLVGGPIGIGHLYIDDGLETPSGVPTPLTPLGFLTVSSVGFDTVSFESAYPPQAGSLNGLTLRFPDLFRDFQIEEVFSWNEIRLLLFELADEYPEDGLAAVVSEGDRMVLFHHYDAVTVRGAATLLSADMLEVGTDLKVIENSTITTHESREIPDGVHASRVSIQAVNIEVDAGSRIHADGKGYPGGNSEETFDANGKTADAAVSSAPQSGGSHAGRGLPLALSGTSFGNVSLQPASPGGGGGGGGSGEAGGDGGGIIDLLAYGEISLAGQISAHGLPGQGGGAGGGAGGSIRLQATSIVATNLTAGIHADGGGMENPGGGGRVALEYTSLDMTSPLTQITARGGEGTSQAAGAGTVFFRDITHFAPSLTLHNGGRATEADSTPYPTDFLFYNRLHLGGGARVVAQEVVALQFLIDTGAVLSHAPNDPNGLYIATDDLTLAADGGIDLSGRGYLGAHRPGNPTAIGQTFPGLDGSGQQAAGSHGGLGHTVAGPPNPLYGDENEPTALGSGGGGGWAGEPGGSGGGRLRLVAVEARIDGEILARGQDGGGGSAGSGAGGSLWIRVNGTLSGDGLIDASGGVGEVPGGGGRVSLDVQFGFWDEERLLAEGSDPAGDGSVVLLYLPPLGLLPPVSTGPASGVTWLRITSMRVEADGSIALTAEGQGGQTLRVLAAPDPDGEYLPVADAAGGDGLRLRPTSRPEIQFFRLEVPADAP